MGEACSTHGGMRKADRILVGKPEGKRQFGRPMFVVYLTTLFQ
jgi:hypothetical protein